MESLKTILVEIMPGLILGLGIVLGMLARKYLKNGTAEERLATEQLIQQVVSQGVNYAEKLAEKRRETFEMSGQEKLYTAMDFIENTLKTNGILDIAKDQLVARVEATLNKEEI